MGILETRVRTILRTSTELTTGADVGWYHPSLDSTAAARSLLLFAVAGLCEIVAGYLVWLWLRNGRSIWIGALAGLVLFLYGVLPTLQPSDVTFGRVYAAYGGVFVMLSLAWGWWIDGTRSDRWDIIGGAVALIGVGIIMYAPRD